MVKAELTWRVLKDFGARQIFCEDKMADPVDEARTMFSRLSDARRGLATMWKERGFKFLTILFIVLLPLVFVVGKTGAERAILILALCLPPIAEVINTALEETVDRISTSYNERSGRIKNLGSLLVGSTEVAAALVWLTLILHP